MAARCRPPSGFLFASKTRWAQGTKKLVLGGFTHFMSDGTTPLSGLQSFLALVIVLCCLQAASARLFSSEKWLNSFLSVLPLFFVESDSCRGKSPLQTDNLHVVGLQIAGCKITCKKRIWVWGPFVGLPGHIFVVPRFPSKSGLIHKHIVKHIGLVWFGGLFF